MSDLQNPQTSQFNSENSVELNSSPVDSNIAKTNTNSVEITPSSVSESPISQKTTKNNKTSLIAAGVIGGLVLVAVVAGIGLSNSKESKSAENSTSNSAKKEDKNQNKSEKNKSENKSETKSQKSENDKLGENKNSQDSQNSQNQNNNSTNNFANPNSMLSNSQNSTTSLNSMTDSTTNSAANPVTNPTTNSANNNPQNNSQNPAQTTNNSENKTDANQTQSQANSKAEELKISPENKEVDRFFEVKAKNEKLNLDPKTMTKEEAVILKGDESKVAIPAAAGKKFRVTLNYSNAGDLDFEKATLTVNVDKALKILPGTVKDTFEGKSVTVADALLKENQIKYGPGTADKDIAGVKVGQKGEMTIDVEVPAGTAPGDYRVATTLENPDGGKGGNPGIVFLTVK